MPSINDFVERGYLPQQLPPPFKSTSLANALPANFTELPAGFQSRSLKTRPVTHDAARPGGLRRKLSIPNPTSFVHLAHVMCSEWGDLVSIFSHSPFSQTLPDEQQEGRLFNSLAALSLRADRRAELRRSNRYILRTDISRFYPSVYTHSIPWAIHTKLVAKANHSDTLVGNLIDRLARNGNDAQTFGIPIGPDTSLVIAECILSVIDVELYNSGICNGFRYIDDYEFGFDSFSEAEEALATIQHVMSGYELDINPAKTIIQSLPLSTETESISELRAFRFRSSSSGQRSDILRYFDRAFWLHNEVSNEAVLRYALARIAGETIHEDNHNLVANLVQQTALVDPSTLSFAFHMLGNLVVQGFELDADSLGVTVNRIIEHSAPIMHCNEVAWALWICLVFEIDLTENAANAVTLTQDDITLLLLLHANQEGLVPTTVNLQQLRQMLLAPELRGSHWLLAYEAYNKGWLPSASGQDIISGNLEFSFLRDEDVTFYDEDELQEARGALDGEFDGFEVEDVFTDYNNLPV